MCRTQGINRYWCWAVSSSLSLLVAKGNISSTLAHLTHQERAHSLHGKSRLPGIVFKGISLLGLHVDSAVALIHSLVTNAFLQIMSYSFPQWAGDITSKCNLGMKSLREPACLSNDFPEAVFLVGLWIIFCPRDKNFSDTCNPPYFFFHFKHFYFLN